MRPRWTTWGVLLALGTDGCAARQLQDETVVLPPDEPLRGDSRGPLSLGETPGDLTVGQVNAALEGHGLWVDTVSYGRVWRPYGVTTFGGFIPYATGGRWLPTDAGWYWQSDYAWGRVPFHYGRWVLDGAVWSWVPGSQFAPAWVDWRFGGGWVGWAAQAPIGARSWAPFVYCNHAGLGAPGVDRRLVTGPAGSSLFAGTTAVTADGDVPRGPPIPGGAVVVATATAWRTPPAETSQRRPASTIGSFRGIDSVERIPVALVHEAPAVVDRPVGGAAVVIRDRDLIGLSEGPSVRRPPESAAPAPEAASRPRPTAVVTVPSAPPTVALAAPPPLPPAPDGVWSGSVGAYPMRAPAGYAPRRAQDSLGEPSIVLAPSRPPQAVAVPTAATGATVTTGLWRGAPAVSQPAGSRPTGGIIAVQ